MSTRLVYGGLAEYDVRGGRMKVRNCSACTGTKVRTRDSETGRGLGAIGVCEAGSIRSMFMRLKHAGAQKGSWILVRNRDVSQKCCCNRVNSGLKKAPSRKGAWILAENHIVLQFGQDSVAVGRDFYLFESDAYLSVFNDLGGIVLQYRNIL